MSLLVPSKTPQIAAGFVGERVKVGVGPWLGETGITFILPHVMHAPNAFGTNFVHGNPLLEPPLGMRFIVSGSWHVVDGLNVPASQTPNVYCNCREVGAVPMLPRLENLAAV